MTIRCVVLDVDDTCYLERDYVRSGFRAIDRHLVSTGGPGGFFEAAWERFERGVRGTTIDEALAAIGHRGDPEVVRDLVRVYREHEPQIALLPDVERLLELWRAAGLRLAVITDGPLASQRAKTRVLGLDARCAPVVHTEALGPGRGKPAPDAFLRVQEATGLDGDAHVYIGDNPDKDFIAPRALGWASLRVRRPGGQHAARDGGGADAEVPDLAAAPPEFAGRLPWR